MAVLKLPGSWLRAFGNRTYLPALLALAVVCAAGYFAERQNGTIHHQSERAGVQRAAGLIKSRLEGQLNGDYQRLRGLAAMLATEPDMPQARFSLLASQVLEGETAIRHIAAAPGLVVSLIHPLEGNEPAIGLDYNKNAAQRDAAYRVRNSGEMVLAGPVDLVQGGSGFIYRLPIFTGTGAERQFWGILSAVVATETLYAATGVNGGSGGLELALTGHDGTGTAGRQFFGAAEVADGDPVLLDINLPVGSWQLAARPQGGWQERPGNRWQLRLALLAAGMEITGVDEHELLDVAAVGLAIFGARVMATVGKKITELTPSRGFAAELGAATTVVLASGTGLPISTTHTLVGAILGVGMARGIGSLNLRVIGTIFTSWVVTLPAGALLSILFFYFFKGLFGA